MEIKNSKHQKLIKTLEERILKKHPKSDIHTNIDYKKGEIDLLCTFSIEKSKKQQNIAYVFEMKSNDSLKNFYKAFSQLDRHKKRYFKKNFLDLTRIYFFYVGGRGEHYLIKKINF